MLLHWFRICPLVLGSLAAGCTVGDLDPVSADDPEIEEQTNEAVLLPELGYGGYDGEHTFQIPLATNLVDAVWEVASDHGAIEVRPTPEAALDTPLVSWALLTTRSGGTVEVTAAAGAARGIARLEITAYTTAEIARGEQRYFTPEDAEGAGRMACASCHTQADGHDHSAVNTMYWSDDRLLRAITTGAYTDDTSLAIEHDWNVTPDEARGIVGFLRSLPPRGF